MPQLPPRPPTKLKNNIIAIPQKLHIEIHVLNRLARDVDMRDAMREMVGHLAHWSDFQGGSDDEHEVHGLDVRGR